MKDSPEKLSLHLLPPQNIEAEQSVLGAVLIDNAALDRVCDELAPEDFYKDAHRRIFAAMLAMQTKRDAIDLVTLTEHLRGDSGLEAIGGPGYLSYLVSIVPTSANISHHARIVRDKAMFRSTINTASAIAEQGYAEPQTVTAEEYVDKAEQAIFQIAQRKGAAASFVPMREASKEGFALIEKRFEQKGKITGLPTGFVDLDHKTAGFEPTDLVIVAARPSMGKTALALGVAGHAAIDCGKSIAIFSLEMSRPQLTLRLIASEARVDLMNIRTGNISGPEWDRLSHAAGRLADSHIHIDDTPALSSLDIRARARRLKSRHNIDLIIIDYLQLMRGHGKEGNREQEVSGFTRGLKALAKELEVPVIALSQLNRSLESRVNKRPMMSDLRESGAIEQDADVILFIYREEQYNECTCPSDCLCGRRGMAEVIIGKQRNGPVGQVPLAYLKAFTRFENAARQ